MCLLIAQRLGAPTLPEQYLRTAWSNNNDGAGYAFLSGEALVVRKPFYKLKALIAAYNEDHAKHGATSPFLVHFRLSTHGGVNHNNTHPHLLSGGHVAVGHNGILSNFVSPLRDESDTAFFCRTVMAHRHPAQVLDPAFISEFIEPLIGPGNKLVFLSTYAPHLAIANEKAGQWDGDHTWFSNNTHCESRYSSYAGYAHGGSSLAPSSAKPGFTSKKRKAHRITTQTPFVQQHPGGLNNDELDVLYGMAYDTIYGIRPRHDPDSLSNEAWCEYASFLKEIRDDLHMMGHDVLLEDDELEEEHRYAEALAAWEEDEDDDRVNLADADDHPLFHNEHNEDAG